MTNLSKWNISIEYGPTAADIHHIIIEASSIESARKKAKKWAKDNNVQHPMISEPCEDTHEEVYDDFLGWTLEEEEAFTDMIGMNRNVDER